ncbi:hypothetical protein QM012_007503 [Aureobasidium pullulans]|uniref:Apple domain-containing protein n=1 Tax=Aureobasidium pullulans TaxID=5580 RepID=A0ABR0TP44_AURPU
MRVEIFERSDVPVDYSVIKQLYTHSQYQYTLFQDQALVILYNNHHYTLSNDYYTHYNTITMRFELFALPVLAAIAEAAAISSKPSSVCTTCPVTIQNTDAAISSVLSVMSAQSPKAVLTTTSITGSPVAATAVAKMSTTAPTSAKPTASSTSSKTSTSSKKRQRRAATSTTSSVVASSTPTNGACSSMPNYGYTYTPSNPAPSAFLKDSTLRAQYMSAAVPANYVWRYAGFYASISQAGYMFYTELSSYSPSQCAAICDANSACKGFNIYFERSPQLVPGDGCVNPAPQVDVKCAFYSTAVSEANAVNIGSWRSSFNVVITGGNGYTKM